MHHPAPLPTPILRELRRRFLEYGHRPLGGIDIRLVRSWQRCRDAGLDPASTVSEPDHLAVAALQRSLALHEELLAHSQPVMEYLYGQVRQGDSMVILADRFGTVMHTLGEGDFLGKAERVALSAGASWHEGERGTNAIGTALIEGASVEIHGPEHFLDRHSFLTCAAAPIHAFTGELMGILDISGDARGRHPHTLGLVQSAVRMIENGLLVAAHRRGIRFHLHSRPEGIGTLAEGIVALSEDGWIVGANRFGLALLGLGPNDLGATRITHLMGNRLDDLLSVSRRHPEHPTELQLRDGRRLYARIVADRPTLIAPATAAPARPADAFAALATGDERWGLAADKARRILDKPIPLLLCGESGVGKEVFARAFHDASARRDGPFVAINCAALPENLIEAELFGYVAGAYTGARREGYAGRLREADGGTLFLDEIGDMPLGLQTRLLRVLQERKVTPLGGSKAVAVDFTLICATHRNLREDVDSGRFRNDLYYRLNGLTLFLPALRERSDLPALTTRLLDEIAPGRQLRVARQVMEGFATYRWPGNVRQYANTLRTAIAMLDPLDFEIDWRHLPDDIVHELNVAEPATDLPPAVCPREMRELSGATLKLALQQSRGNVSEAARRLGISRQTLYRKLKARA